MREGDRVREGQGIEEGWVKCYKEDAIQIKFSLLSAFRVVTNIYI